MKRIICLIGLIFISCAEAKEIEQLGTIYTPTAQMCKFAKAKYEAGTSDIGVYGDYAICAYFVNLHPKLHHFTP